MDYKIDQSGNVVFVDGGFAYVSGTDEFEQQLGLWLQYIYLQTIGTTSRQANLIEKLRVEANRVADEFDLIEGVTDFRAVRAGPNSYELFIEYDADGDQLANLNIGMEDGEPIMEPLSEGDFTL